MGESTAETPRESVGQRIVRAMFVIIFFQVFWKFGGLIITLLVGSVFGSSPESDAFFFVSETVVFLLQTLCLKLFIPVVVPIFKEQLGQEGEQAAWRFGSTVLNLAIVALAALTVAGMVFAPQITSLIAEGFNERQALLSTRLMRWMFPGVFAICLATVTYALLNSYNIFGYAAAGDAVQKMIWAGIFLVASVVGFAAARMLDVVAVAFLLAAAATLVTHLVGLRAKLRFYRPGLPGLGPLRIATEAAILAAHAIALGAGLWAARLLGPSLGSERAVMSLQQVVLVVVVSAYLLLLWWRARRRATPMAKFGALVVPLLFGILFAKYRDVITNLFASFTGTGVFSDLKYARRIGEAPNTLVIAALSIAILPHLCELATGRRWNEFGDVMTRTIRSIVVFFVPFAALTVVLRRPIIELLFDRGNWTDYHLSHAGDALGLYILSLPFFAIENPIQQSFFAMQRMWAPTLIGFIGTGFHVLFLFVGIEWLGFGYFAVVALVYVAARAFKNIILLLVMRYHVKILPWRQSVVFLAKALAITLAVVLVAHYVYAPLRTRLSLEPYRRHEAMLDTFNVELNDWESDNVDDLRIVGRDAPELQDAFRGLGQAGAPLVDGQNALMARYRRSPRRSAGLRRDLTALDLLGGYDLRLRKEGWEPTLAFDVAASQDADLAVELVTRDRRSFPIGQFKLAAGKRQRLSITAPGPREGTIGEIVQGFTRGMNALREAVGLWIRDVTPVSRVAAKPTTLVLDNLTLSYVKARWLSPAEADAEDAGHPAPRPPDQTTLDDFEPAATDWRPAPQAASFRVDDTGERPDTPELALHFPRRDEPTVASRFVGMCRLAGADALKFKARADRPCALKLRLVISAGYAPQGAAAPRSEWEATVPLAASDRRKSYSVPIGKFAWSAPPVKEPARAPTGAPDAPPSAPDEDVLRYAELLEVEAPAGVEVWLDNIVFVRDPKGPKLGSISVLYELFKLIHVTVPSIAAFAVFVLLLFALRVEEGREAWGWMKERVVSRVIAKVRRRRNP